MQKKDSMRTIDPLSTHTVQHNYLDYMSKATKARGRDVQLNYFPCLILYCKNFQLCLGVRNVRTESWIFLEILTTFIVICKYLHCTITSTTSPRLLTPVVKIMSSCFPWSDICTAQILSCAWVFKTSALNLFWFRVAFPVLNCFPISTFTAPVTLLNVAAPTSPSRM